MPDPIQILIVDDERLARRSIRSALHGVEDAAVAGEAGGVNAAAEQIHTSEPDVVLLDVQMRGETGFDLLDRLDAPVQVIFVTAHDEYAVRAFEVNALDYLLKPVDPDRLAEALQRARQAETALPNDEEATPDAFQYDDLFFYEEGRRPRFIRIREIVFIAAAGNYTELHLTDGDTALTSTTLSTWTDRLPNAHFARIHRSTIVNVERVATVEQGDGRTYSVHVEGRDDPLSMSRRRARALRDRLA
ncbi:LytR/AlgR family response regulator transcription factor [Salinibacter sp.]|uniref:LytR/AlgR family response regulator transcription factor n=1 Tax=Salinibacter sp. TaxID=2065818 RepID=UPI0021E6FE37|nr:LytTR family DNA-binding domain-containing protein [Salinibacter sp.]